MKRLTIAIAFSLLMFACKRDSQVEPIDDVIQGHIDNIILNSGVDMGFSIVSSSTGEGGAFQDTDMTVRAEGNLDKVAALKGFGNNPWNTSNLILVRNFDKSNVWFSEELDSNGDPIDSHGQMLIRDHGNGYKFLKIYNGPPYRMDTEPISISPSLENPVDIIQVVRVLPCVPGERDGLILRRSSDWNIDLSSPPLTTGTTNLLHHLIYVRFTLDASGNWELRYNDLDKATPDASGSGYFINRTEEWVGAQGHPLEEQWFCKLYKFGEFNASELNLLQTSFESIWPLGLPTYPYDDGGEIVSTLFDRDNNTWEAPVGEFGGGSGDAGQYIFRWYFHSGDTERFPVQDKLDEHVMIDPTLVPSASTSVLSRDEMVSAGIYYTNGIEPGNPASSVSIMSVRIPIDSEGAVGEPLQSSWVRDNIQ